MFSLVWGIGYRIVGTLAAKQLAEWRQDRLVRRLRCYQLRTRPGGCCPSRWQGHLL